jgi:hypothetical protein
MGGSTRSDVPIGIFLIKPKILLGEAGARQLLHAERPRAGFFAYAREL